MAPQAETKGDAMHDRPHELGTSLADTLKHSEISSVGFDLTEVALDSALPEGILRDIPVLGVLTALWRAGRTVRDFLFTKKLLAFLTALRDVPAHDRSVMIQRLEADPQFGRHVGEEIVLLLDRLDSMTKATLIGRAFRAYCLGLFDVLTLQRVNHAIDRILERDLRQLRDFVGNEQSTGGITKQAFLNAGLAYMPDGMATTTIKADRQLCTLIIKYVLTEINVD